MASWDTFVHLFAGGVGGTMGAIVTCPLEVVKTRLQSSHSGFELRVPAPAAETPGAVTCRSLQSDRRWPLYAGGTRHEHVTLPGGGGGGGGGGPPRSVGLVRCIRIIIEKEGAYALWKGLGPNLVGVAPSRAIYFCSYSNAKKFFNRRLTPETPLVHMASAVCAGFFSCTATNPIWFIKTRLQLDQHKFGQRLRVADCVRRVYAEKGVRGFYKGITASYFGITETMIHFVIYEHIKQQLQAYRLDHTGMTDVQRHADSSVKTSWDFVEFMLAGAVSKTVASSVAYPHEVARTRLREEGTKYRRFFQTLQVVWSEEGHRGLYRGLGTQLVRQIPNTAIMMSTYEAVVYLLRDESDELDSMYEEEEPPAPECQSGSRVSYA